MTASKQEQRAVVIPLDAASRRPGLELRVYETNRGELMAFLYVQERGALELLQAALDEIDHKRQGMEEQMREAAGRGRS